MSTYEAVRDILQSEWGIGDDQLAGGEAAFDDLGIDSLDLLNLVFALETRVGVKIPIQDWIKARNEGDPDWQMMTLRRLSAQIDALPVA